MTLAHKVIPVSSVQLNETSSAPCAVCPPPQASLFLPHFPPPLPTSAQSRPPSLWLPPHCHLCLRASYTWFIANPATFLQHMSSGGQAGTSVQAITTLFYGYGENRTLMRILSSTLRVYIAFWYLSCCGLRLEILGKEESSCGLPTGGRTHTSINTQASLGRSGSYTYLFQSRRNTR